MSDGEALRRPLKVGDVALVRKLDYATGEPMMSWPGRLIELTPEQAVVQAPFMPRGVNPVVVDGVPFNRGDVFTEYYFLGRWYNVFHIADASGRRKGWYCNVTRPPGLDGEGVTFVDLALDLFAHPDGRHTVLDEEEFLAASQRLYRPEDVAGARAALDDLIALARAGRLPTPSRGG